MRYLALIAIFAGMVRAQQQSTVEQQQQKIQEALQKLDDLAQQQRQASGQPPEVRARIDELRAQTAALQSQIAAAQARREDLRTRYNDAHPDLKALNAKLALLQTELLNVEGSIRQLQQTEWQNTFPPLPADTLKLALPDRWWKNPVISQYLVLAADQQKKMDDVVEQFRPKLSNLTSQLKASETVLGPLVSADPLNEEKIVAQIDAIAFLRSELEKANGRMLLGLRKLLTPEQWTKLNQAFTLNLAQ